MPNSRAFHNESLALSVRTSASHFSYGGTPLTAEDYDPYLHSRRIAWEPRSHIVSAGSSLVRCTGSTPHAWTHSEGSAWASYPRQNILNLHVARHPFWVAKAPGTGVTTQERWNLALTPPTRKATMGRVPWDSSFIAAHVLDGNPVLRGSRRLSPSRPKHER